MAQQVCKCCGAPVRPVKSAKATGNVPEGYVGFWCPTCDKPVAAERTSGRPPIHDKRWGGCGNPVDVIGSRSEAVEFDREAVLASTIQPEAATEIPPGIPVETPEPIPGAPTVTHAEVRRPKRERKDAAAE